MVGDLRFSSVSRHLFRVVPSLERVKGGDERSSGSEEAELNRSDLDKHSVQGSSAF